MTALLDRRKAPSIPRLIEELDNIALSLGDGEYNAATVQIVPADGGGWEVHVEYREGE